MTVVEAFGDLADVLARMDPVKIIDLKASEGVAERVSILIGKKKDGLISGEEGVELERYLASGLTYQPG